MQKGITIFRQNCFVSQYRIISQRNPSVFQKFWVSKNFMPKRRISLFSTENLLSQSTEKLRRGNLLCFTIFLVSNNFMDRRGGGGGREEGGSITILCQNFCLTVPNHFVEEPFCVSESFTHRKILCLKVEYHDFL